MYFTVADCNTETLAYASECTSDQMNFRPLSGFTNICPQVCHMWYKSGKVMCLG